MRKKGKYKNRIITFVLLLALILPSVTMQEGLKAEAAGTGWIKTGSRWYYYISADSVLTGWKKWKNQWYYFNEKGVMQTGWKKISGKWYYLRPDGSMATGWKKLGSKWYFLDKNGIMSAGEYRQGCWLGKNGVWSAKYKAGKWMKNKKGWWYQDGKWYPKHMWLWIDGYCYYFDAQGYLVTDSVVQGSSVDQNGVWVKGGVKMRKTSDVKKSGHLDLGTTDAKEKALIEKAASYDYEIVPLVESLNTYYLIKTDNPDPTSFWFVDDNTKYGEKGTISPILTLYPDVLYENKNTARVHGGYLAAGSEVDGGTVRLEARRVTGQGKHEEVDINTGETLKEYSVNTYEYLETDTRIDMPVVVDSADYALATYAKDVDGFFETLDAVQAGLDKDAIYNGAYVNGEIYQAKERPYYALSTAYYPEQDFFSISPYGQKQTEELFATALYPYFLTSVGFPGLMGYIAKQLDENVKLELATDMHWIVEITHDGKTRGYGGAGRPYGQGINKDQVIHRFLFDGSSGDCAKDLTLQSLKDIQLSYDSMNVPSDPAITQKGITVNDVYQTVGDGAYVSVLTMGYSMMGGPVYSYIYDNGSADSSISGYTSMGYISNAWYDGRYFNDREYFFPGATFEETVTDVQPALVFKDYTMRVPDDGVNYTYHGAELSTLGYDPTTGTWKGYTCFNYDADHNCWVSERSIDEIGHYENGVWIPISDQDFIDQCTITWEEAIEMDLDYNTDVDPDEYFIYDGTVPPGTKKTR